MHITVQMHCDKRCGKIFAVKKGTQEATNNCNKVQMKGLISVAAKNECTINLLY